MVGNEARGSQIDDFDQTSAVTLNENIFWLQVTVDQLERVDILECS